jgi:hypothetical protein
MKDAKKFWIVLVSTLIISLIAFYCQGCYPDNPPVARWNCGNISAGSLDTPAYGTNGRYQNGLSRPDGGSTGMPRLGYWITCENATGGMRIDCACVLGDLDIPPGMGTVEATTSKNAYINEKGYAIAYATGSASSTYLSPYYKYHFYFQARLPRGGSAEISSFFAREGINAGYFDYSSGKLGEFFCSYSERPTLDIASIISTSDRRGISSIGNSADDASFLSQSREPSELHVNVVDVIWSKVCLSDSYGLSPISEFRVLNNHDEEAIKDYSNPYTAVYHFVTATPISLTGQSYCAKLSIGDPNDPNYITDIAINVVSDSNDLISHVARSGWIVPAEPNDFTPYILNTDFGDVLVCPLDEGQTLKIELTDWTQFVFMVAPYWLTSFKALDKNSDGIFNLKDLP